ncbi:MAG: hypothetical protein QJR06_05340 [Alicyclobacillaceae bacterium]|nr:hypothetical protein [Alicyclobacillaceae bacterium]
MGEGSAPDRPPGPRRPEVAPPEWDKMAEEDIEEGMDRMMNEGGGVVNHYLYDDVPVHRNALVNGEENEAPGPS